MKYDHEEIGPALFDLHRDIGETTDVQDRYPEVFRRLMSAADAARADLGDKLTEIEGTGRRSCGFLEDHEERLNW